MQVEELVDEYRKRTDEELMLLARDREQLTPEALSPLTDELACRKIGAAQVEAFRKEQEREEHEDTFRTKQRLARTADRWWLRFQLRIQMVAVYAVAVLVYHLLPFKIPDDWEDAAVVTFLCTVAIGFGFREYWKRRSFWVALATAAVAQLWAIKRLHPGAHRRYNNASLVTGFAVGFLIWGAMFLLLRRVRQDSDTHSEVPK